MMHVQYNAQPQKLNNGITVPRLTLNNNIKIVPTAELLTLISIICTLHNCFIINTIQHHYINQAIQLINQNSSKHAKQ